jgi:hypothetical protein
MVRGRANKSIRSELVLLCLPPQRRLSRWLTQDSRPNLREPFKRADVCGGTRCRCGRTGSARPACAGRHRLGRTSGARCVLALPKSFHPTRKASGIVVGVAGSAPERNVSVDPPLVPFFRPAGWLRYENGPAGVAGPLVGSVCGLLTSSAHPVAFGSPRMATHGAQT